MAKEKKLPEAGNTGELNRLKKEIETLKKAINGQNAELEKVKAERNAVIRENESLTSAIDKATARIKNLEEAVNKEQQGFDNIKEGWVVLASCPLKDGTKPPQTVSDGIPLPRLVDEDGLCIEDMPVKTAIQLLSENSGYKRYLLGPVNSISGVIRVGMYNKTMTYHRHKKVKNADGGYEFVRTMIDEQTPKA
jgi:hypothetical protein